jgi:hypothetical protein
LEREALSQDWLGFFQALAAVTVTAFSVLFIVLQLKADQWRDYPLRNCAAVGALTELLVPLLTALICLTGPHPWPLACALTGAFGLGVIAWHWRTYFVTRAGAREDAEHATVPPKPDEFDIRQLKLNFISATVYSGFVACALLHDTFGFTLGVLGALCVWLVLSGTSEAWWLLLERPPDKSISQGAGADS